MQAVEIEGIPISGKFHKEPTVITCFIRYEIDPFKRDAFEIYAKAWGEAIPRCGADLVGYFAPHKGSPPHRACAARLWDVKPSRGTF